jgi:hypothetical protein
MQETWKCLAMFLGLLVGIATFAFVLRKVNDFWEWIDFLIIMPRTRRGVRQSHAPWWAAVLGSFALSSLFVVPAGVGFVAGLLLYRFVV